MGVDVLNVEPQCQTFNFKIKENGKPTDFKVHINPKGGEYVLDMDETEGTMAESELLAILQIVRKMNATWYPRRKPKQAKKLV